MPRPLKPIKTKWWTPPDSPRTRLALTGKAGPDKAGDDEATAAAGAVAVFIATGVL